ncbi:MAG: hypothetical protein NT164_07195 [Verrucomicrobiae bacterium]|nr:hypothetical protein [Verrucomicrobiae bacterium]
MNISSSAKQKSVAPDFNAYEKFAATSYDESKIVAAVNGHKIQIATRGPDEKLSSYILKNGLNFELSNEKSIAVVDHFKQALRLKYGEEARGSFMPEHEQEALSKGLSQHIIKEVTKNASLRKSFEQVRSCRTSLSLAFDQYNTQKSNPYSTAAERAETELKLAQLMLGHQELVADFKLAAKENPDQARAGSMLQNLCLVAGEKESIQAANTFIQAAEHFIEAAGQAMDNLDSRSSISKKHAIAEQHLQKAETVLANLQNSLLNVAAKNPTIKNHHIETLEQIRQIRYDIKNKENSMLLPPLKKPALSLTISSAASESDASKITQEKLKLSHDAVFAKLDTAQQEKKTPAPTAPKKEPPAAGGARFRF